MMESPPSDRRRNRNRHAIAFAAILATALAACDRQPTDEAPPIEPAQDSNPLFVDPASRDFSANPKLLQRILATPHGYFRFINVPFSHEVCGRFGADLVGTPTFNLHGDAHIEQYATTDLGRGLTDFDDSSTGPAIVDLARFGVSLYLASDLAGLGAEADSLFDEFLRGYRAALDDPSTEVEEPRLAARKRAKFKYDREAYFRFIDSLMEPVPEDEQRGLVESLGPYIEVMHEESPELAADFFTVERLGYLRQGIGSALDIKYLARTRGPSADPLDDVVLEIKQVRDLTDIGCISVAAGPDPFRVLIGQARIATEPYKFLGYARFREHTFWVHAWVENYSEIDIDDDLASAEEVAEVAFDVGLQLGRGHVKAIAQPLDLQLRKEQMRLIDRDAEKIKTACRELAALTVEAWERFKAGA
ncbi:MAG: DUF2252 domain-containing protein [bacterium]|nr:DUF2252 domain-containing protein [bacterium]